MPRKNKRQPLPELPVPGVSFFSDVDAVWMITMRHGGAQRQITVRGTQATAWSYAELCGRQAGNLAGFAPVDIMHYQSVECAEAFATV